VVDPFRESITIIKDDWGIGVGASANVRVDLEASRRSLLWREM